MTVVTVCILYFGKGLIYESSISLFAWIYEKKIIL